MGIRVSRFTRQPVVVQLPIGSAVFVPLGPALYETRWVVGGPAEGAMIPVREGVKPGTLVVLHGLAALVAAARDSLMAVRAR
jgi:hypothetical protein